MLHADDPVFVESSKGALQNVMDVAAGWCYKFKCAFHEGSDKNVMQVVGHAASAHAAGDAFALVMYRAVGAPAASLHMAAQHTWLGLVWRSDLDFAPALKSRISSCDCKLSELAGLVKRDWGGWRHPPSPIPPNERLPIPWLAPMPPGW